MTQRLIAPAGQALHLSQHNPGEMGSADLLEVHALALL
jgi:hypothetical protein